MILLPILNSLYRQTVYSKTILKADPLSYVFLTIQKQQEIKHNQLPKGSEQDLISHKKESQKMNLKDSVLHLNN
jgi:hypothetical protein